MTTYFIQAFIYLCAAVIAVPLAKRLGLGSVLGYLIAGVVIGPVTNLVGHETGTIQHFAEFGVVMMLFLVGLELEPKSLWAMRQRLLGLGGLQVSITVVLAAGIALLFGLSPMMSLAVGLIFSLSSTAIVLQTFNEKGLTKTDGGRAAFSVLLFQDIAVIPMLALIPLLAMPELVQHGHDIAHADAHHGDTHGHHEELSLVAGLPGWLQAIITISAIAAVVAGGHFLSRPLLRYVASSGLREIFTTTALMLVIGIAALMSLVGLSPALGTFLAGVVLATSEFRHELESDIEPFKGILLGLFFITVGAGIRFDILSDNLGLILGLTLGLIILKATVLFILAIIFNVRSSDRWLLTLSLAQAGEFGFVLISFSVQNNVLPVELSQVLAMVVAISMFLTPGLFICFEKFIVPRFEAQENAKEDDIDDRGTVIIAGIGRVGQIINRMLVANGIRTIVLDNQVGQVDVMRSINVKSYFGDASRPDLLHTAGIEEAKLLVIAIDDRVRSVELAHHVRKTFPYISILARAYDRGHSYELRNAGADVIISETYFSAVELGRQSLVEMGMHPFKAEQLKHYFVDTEHAHDETLYESWRDMEEANNFTGHYRDLFMQLEDLLRKAMSKDRSDGHSLSERGWTPPPKNYADSLESDK